MEESGNGSPLPRYVPLTERFVRDHAPALLELDSFGSACAAIESSDLAGTYLEEFGIDVPPEPPGPRRAGGDGLPVPPVGGLHRLLARRRQAGRGDRRARGRRPGRGTMRSRWSFPARPADAPGSPGAGDGDDHSRGYRRRAGRGARRGGGRRRRLGAHLPRRRTRQRGRGRRAGWAKPGRRGPFRGGFSSADHRASPLPGRRGGPGALRVDARRGGPLAADRDGRRAAQAGRLPAPGRLARRADHALARARVPLELGRARRPRQVRRGGAGDLPLRGGPGAKRRAGGAERLPAGASVRARGRGSGRHGPGDAGCRPLRGARAALRDQGSRGPGARFGAPAMERRPGSGGGGGSDGGRDGGRDRGADARHPQGRRLRPPGRRPSCHRRRGPAG